MKVYVIDAYGLSAVGELVAAERLKDVLHKLTDIAINHGLRYPDSVWRECCRHLDECGMGLWAKTAFGHLPKDSSTWEHEDNVLNIVPGLVDPDTSEYQTQVDVAKMAVWLSETDDEVVVVTEDTGERPDRVSLEKACVSLGIVTLTTIEFLTEVLPFKFS